MVGNERGKRRLRCNIYENVLIYDGKISSSLKKNGE